ncbi:hypothetical protein BJ165DRAFT_1401961 [Panaeolus papilionaceus]|nr:hypothetical protein BJ165DRAFT_1401961 [Panaeolus papilionaceus]
MSELEGIGRQHRQGIHSESSRSPAQAIARKHLNDWWPKKLRTFSSSLGSCRSRRHYRRGPWVLQAVELHTSRDEETPRKTSLATFRHGINQFIRAHNPMNAQPTLDGLRFSLSEIPVHPMPPSGSCAFQVVKNSKRFLNSLILWNARSEGVGDAQVKQKQRLSAVANKAHQHL